MRQNLALKNSSITLLCQVLDIILSFAIRKLFIEYIGVELLGINGTFSSILGALSLAELGFEGAVIYSLYKPISENDKKSIEDIVIILKRIYTFVGIFILISSLLIMPLLPNILKGIKVTKYVYIAYYIQVVSSAVTYFLAYKRTLLYALKKDYIRNLYITMYKLMAAILHIIVILSFKSYIGYVLIIFVQNLFTNISMSHYCDKHYDYDFKKRKINKDFFNKIFIDVKDIFWGKIAGYIYFSTDNIVISYFVGTVSVGFLSNYTQIFTQLKVVINNILNSNKPIIGELLNQNSDKAHTLRIFNRYTFIRYILCSVIFIPGAVLIDCFITSWLSNQYVLPIGITLLITADLFITFVHGALVDYIAGLGYFYYDKKISIIGAIINLMTSIILVNIIGIYGVLIGTIISQMFFWIMRSVIIFKHYYNDLKIEFKIYWKRQIIYIIVFCINIILGRFIMGMIPLNDSYIKFLIGGVCILMVVISINCILFNKSDEYKYLKNLSVSIFNKINIKKHRSRNFIN